MKIFTSVFMLIALSTPLVVAQDGGPNALPPADSMVTVSSVYLAELERTYGTINNRDVAMKAPASDPIILGLLEEETSPFVYEVFPQRTKDYLQLDLPVEDDFVLRIYDRAGEVVISHDQLYGFNQINLKHLQQGIYRVKVTSDAGTIEEWIAKED